MKKLIKLLCVLICQVAGLSLFGFYSVEYNYSHSFDDSVDYVRLLIPEDFYADSVSVETEPTASSTISAEILGNYYFGENRIVNLKVYAANSKPEREKEISLEDLKIKLSCSPSFTVLGNKFSRDPYSDRIINSALESIIDNKEDIPPYSYKPFNGNYTAQGESALRQIYCTPYIVITADSLKDAFQPLVHWITRKGIRATVVSVEDILAFYSGDPVSGIYDPAGAIRGFLIDNYRWGLQWVLLGGDEEIVPVRYGYSTGEDEVDRTPPSDLYYSDLNGNWNVDGDEFYGEFLDDSIDLYPELFVGRIPCNKRIEAENWVGKVLIYERNPGNGDPSYLSRVLWTGADELRTAPDYIIRYGSFPSYFTHDTTMLEEEDGIHPRGSEVIARMKNCYGWFNLYGHGGPDNMVVSCPGPNHPSLDRDFIGSLDTCDAYFHANHWGNNVEPGNGIDSLMVGDSYGIMYVSSCYQAAYDMEHFAVFDNCYGPSLAEAFTLLGERGGVAFLGFTRAIEFSTALHFDLLEVLFNDSLTNIGVAEAIAKISNYSHKTWLSHTLFGNPLMPVWTDIPEPMSVSFRKSIPPEPIHFNVAVMEGGVPLKDAYVCLWKGQEIYETGFTDPGGSLILQIYPRSEGIMLLTVTKDNFIPYLDTVHIDSQISSISINGESDLPSCAIDRNISPDKVRFTFYLPQEEKIKLGIFDLTGRMIVELTDKRYKKGSHSLCWDAENSKGHCISSGIYFYRFQYRERILSDKFLLLR
ncbi:hypothetical protein JW879_01590 [candidate division WOR-3 bacterium]|nr:hypothetical protein [candidate division WOR-3 bacterium]